MPALTFNDVGLALHNICTKYSLLNGWTYDPLLRAIMGDRLEPGDVGDKSRPDLPRFARVDTEFDGEVFRYDLMKAQSGYTRAAAPSDRIAARSLDTTDKYAPATFLPTMFPIGEDVDAMKVERITAQMRQGKGDLLELEAKRILNRTQITFIKALLSTTTNANTDLVSGGLPFGIDAANTYGGVDRSDATGAMFRGQVLDLDNVTDTEILTLDHLTEMQAAADSTVGSVSLVVCGRAIWAKLARKVEVLAGQGASAMSGDTLMVGKQHFTYRGMTVIPSPWITANMVLGLCPESIHIKAKLPSLDEGSYTWSRNQGTNASWLYQSEILLSCVVEVPGANFKILNAEDVA